MSARVSALLQLARSPEKLQIDALPMRPVLRDEIERCRPLLEGKSVTLSLDAPAEVWVNADADLVAIAVGNLLRNACESTQQGTVRVALAADALIVEDTGPGIPDAVRARLFEPFVRGENPSYSGAGLGLAIVKRVAERLGWLVSLEHAPQGGPASRSRSRRSLEPHMGPNPNSPRKPAHTPRMTMSAFSPTMLAVLIQSHPPCTAIFIQRLLSFFSLPSVRA